MKLSIGDFILDAVAKQRENWASIAGLAESIFDINVVGQDKNITESSANSKGGINRSLVFENKRV